MQKTAARDSRIRKPAHEKRETAGPRGLKNSYVCGMIAKSRANHGRKEVLLAFIPFF